MGFEYMDRELLWHGFAVSLWSYWVFVWCGNKVMWPVGQMLLLKNLYFAGISILCLAVRQFPKNKELSLAPPGTKILIIVRTSEWSWSEEVCSLWRVAIQSTRNRMHACLLLLLHKGNYRIDMKCKRYPICYQRKNGKVLLNSV